MGIAFPRKIETKEELGDDFCTDMGGNELECLKESDEKPPKTRTVSSSSSSGSLESCRMETKPYVDSGFGENSCTDVASSVDGHVGTASTLEEGSSDEEPDSKVTQQCLTLEPPPSVRSVHSVEMKGACGRGNFKKKQDTEKATILRKLQGVVGRDAVNKLNGCVIFTVALLFLSFYGVPCCLFCFFVCFYRVCSGGAQEQAMPCLRLPQHLRQSVGRAICGWTHEQEFQSADQCSIHGSRPVPRSRYLGLHACGLCDRYWT